MSAHRSLIYIDEFENIYHPVRVWDTLTANMIVSDGDLDAVNVNTMQVNTVATTTSMTTTTLSTQTINHISIPTIYTNVENQDVIVNGLSLEVLAGLHSNFNAFLLGLLNY